MWARPTYKGRSYGLNKELGRRTNLSRANFSGPGQPTDLINFRHHLTINKGHILVCVRKEYVMTKFSSLGKVLQLELHIAAAQTLSCDSVRPPRL